MDTTATAIPAASLLIQTRQTSTPHFGSAPASLTSGLHQQLSCGRRWLICSHAPVGRPPAPVAVIWSIDHSILLLFRCERRDRSRCCTAASRMGMAARPNRNLTTDESIEPNDSASLYHTPVSAALDRFVTGNTKWPRSTGTRSSLGVYCIDRAMRTYNAILI